MVYYVYSLCLFLIYTLCETEITEDNFNSIHNNKTPGNHDLSREFSETFWEDTKDVFINSLKQAKIKGSLT